ncbi:MAG TPA: MYXO-CTERM sorting domain-containing protein [Polyangiaceae bacterium]|nr:MYXO-CTERM sorting domain-containing protein [Polyangiaceae bacterium]
MTAMRLRTALLSASLLFAATPSLANGRFPLSQRLFQDQGNQDHFVVSATFGLLVSRDHGLNWYHVCEAALTSGIETADPLLELTTDGSMLSALVRPLRRSSDCGCTWEAVLGDGADQSLTDITKSGANTLLALARTSGPPTVFRIERSSDDGRTWSKVSDLPQNLQAFTFDAAPSNPMRVYVSVILKADPDAGMPQSVPAVLVSDDGGVNFGVPRPIQGATAVDQPYIAAVHPTDPDTLYLRTDAWTQNTETEIDEANDALFVSDDAGVSFREVLRKHAKLFGFAISPDASTVLAGYGDPVQAARDVYPEDTGIYTASAADLAFTQALNAPVSCLTWNGNGLYACFDETVGITQGGAIPPTPEGFATILAYENVKGPAACNATTCTPEWKEGREDIPAVCARLGADCDIDVTMNVLDCSSSGSPGGMGGSGGSGAAATGGAAMGGSAMAGMGAVTSGSSPGGAGGAPSGARASGGGGGEPDSGSSCGCRAPGGTGRGASFVLLALLAILGIRRRKQLTTKD